MPKTKTFKNLYWALIITFTLLYLAVAFVSTLHAITFFEITNSLWLAIMLGAAYEIGQATVLFSIIMTENKNKMLAWLMMFLLTTLQVTANVYASFMYMDTASGNDWEYWQRSILFWVEADTPEMYKIIISWISGALLPLVALGMTALVADNVQHTQHEHLEEEQKRREEEKKKEEEEEDEEDSLDKLARGVGNMFKKKQKTEEPQQSKEPQQEQKKEKSVTIKDPSKSFDENEEDYLINLQDQQANSSESKPFFPETEEERRKIESEKEAQANAEKISEGVIESTGKQLTNKSQPITNDPSESNGETEDQRLDGKNLKGQREIPHVPKEERAQLQEGTDVKPSNKQRGWHLKKRFVDDEGKVFSKGKYIGMIDSSNNETPPSQSKKVKG